MARPSKYRNPWRTGRKVLLVSGLAAMLLGCSKDRDDLPQDLLLPNNGELVSARVFGGSGADTGRSIIQTADGGLAILGFSESTDGDLQGKALAVNDYWLLKLDAHGTLEWSRTYGGSKDDVGQAVIQTSDGGYALTGYAMSDDGDGSNNEGFHDNWVLRLDPQGEILWERSFGFSGHDHSYDILQTDDGGFFFIGFLDLTAARADGFEGKGNYATLHGVGEFWCTKIDQRGELQWRYYFGGTNNDRAHAVVPSPDGGFVMAGFSESEDFDITDPNGSYDFWVVKVQADGQLVWQKNLGGTGIDIAWDLTRSADGGYLVAGHSFSSDGDVSDPQGEADMWLVKLSEAGEFLWDASYGGAAFDAAESITPAADGGFYLTGSSRSSGDDLENAGENDLLIVKIGPDGATEWRRTYGGTGLDLGFDAVETSDGALMVIGELAEPGAAGLPTRGATDLLLLQFR